MSAASTNDEPVVVYQATDPVVARMVRGKLEEAGIESTLTNEQQGAFSGIDIVPVEVIVKAADADRARQVIAEYEEEEDHGET